MCVCVSVRSMYICLCRAVHTSTRFRFNVYSFLIEYEFLYYCFQLSLVRLFSLSPPHVYYLFRFLYHLCIFARLSMLLFFTIFVRLWFFVSLHFQLCAHTKLFSLPSIYTNTHIHTHPHSLTHSLTTPMKYHTHI